MDERADLANQVKERPREMASQPVAPVRNSRDIVEAARRKRHDLSLLAAHNTLTKHKFIQFLSEYIRMNNLIHEILTDAFCDIQRVV
jgi:hypothetical protein